MERTINKTVFSVIALITLLVINACTTKNKDGEGYPPGIAAATNEHEEENSTLLTGEQVEAVGIEIGAVEQKQLTATLKANGVLRVPNTNKANVTSLFGGIIKSLKVELGDYVKKGQIIATISNPEFIRLQEEYLNIDSRIAFAEQELARQRELYEGNVGAKKNLQSATAERNTLQTRKASLDRQIHMMGINPAILSNSNLKSSLVVSSPISGVISEVFAKIGSYVDVSSPIAEIIENAALHLDLQVFEKDIPSIQTGQEIDFVVTNNPDKTYSAEVYSIGSSFSGSSKTIAVHCKVIGDKTGLIDGMNITGIVSSGRVSGLAVPNDALVHADGRYYIFLVKEQGEEPHEHQEGERHDRGTEQGTRFERIEVVKGASQLGYTAILPVDEIPQHAPIVVKGAFFVNAKMDASEGHAHAH